MSFTPPSFANLGAYTFDLDEKLSVALGRYSIVPISSSSHASSSAQEQVVPSALEILLSRVHCVLDADTDRKTAKEAINLLSQDMRHVLQEGKEDKCKEGTQFLLGALLHRYFRLLNEYDKPKFLPSFWSSPYNPKNCRLFLAIRKALGLPDDMSGDFRTRDLERLDVTTVVTALIAFRDNMKVQDRYLKYPHYAGDSNFFTYLNDIINEQLARDNGILKQYKAVRFIQSFYRRVDADLKRTEEILGIWCKQLANAHPDFKSLSSSDILQHLNNTVKSVADRRTITDLLLIPSIADKLKEMDHAAFLSAMNKASVNRAQYIVVGGYVLLLQSQAISPELNFEIHESLGLRLSEQLTDIDMYYPVYLVEKYMENNRAFDVDYDFFGDRSGFNTQVKRTLIMLKARIDNPSLELSEASSSVAP
ncbi:hypothetical protein [Legionella worsleiensis]|uniref:Substrate of the Dot/Icm secretion system n=1 Tax=Legionella worsleiensis TaxID=45076 RepID=A0A0W1A460_9GAMM|nr:hypothetical protein [Legionella worsleiensis]KTD76149.1 substrate of the Dot/Icm secretion system [Legionella worsleiensis]STY33275.1 Dot/Icm secretion system substrate [Legionella worsleiensis]